MGLVIQCLGFGMFQNRFSSAVSHVATALLPDFLHSHLVTYRVNSRIIGTLDENRQTIEATPMTHAVIDILRIQGC